MQIDKYICDHCCKEIDKVDGYIYETIGIGDRFSTVELCKDCANELMEIIDNFASKRSGM